MFCISSVGAKVSKRDVYHQVRDSLTGELIPYVVLDEVVVIPQNEKKRYSRRNNPAVELLKNVLKHKAENTYMSDSAEFQMYEKLTMSVDPFDFNLDKTSFRRELKFLEKYVDTLQLNYQRRPYLPISLREKLSVVNSTKPHEREIYARTWAGMDKFFEQGTLDANINALFVPVDVRDNNMDLMLIQFVSPLSTTQANAFYHYYILDTLQIDGLQCIDLGFVPVNSNMLSFAGHLYVVNDSSYAVRKCVMGVTSKVNLNWISNLRITQDFMQMANGQWETSSTLMETNFTLHRLMRHSIYARHLIEYDNVADVESVECLNVNDSIAAHRSKQWWVDNRPIALSHSEEICDSMAYELWNTKTFPRFVKTMKVLREGYIPTSSDFTFENSYWDFGQILKTVSYNGIEGWRVRIGGMTTAQMHPNIFFEPYIAYGFGDKRPKGGATLTYSFNKKQHYANESLRHAISWSGMYDLEMPGFMGGAIARDNILQSLDPHSWANPKRWNSKGLYVVRGRMTYEQEWVSRFDLKTYLEYERDMPAGTLDFKPFQSLNWNINMSYTPHKPWYNARTQKRRLSELSKKSLELTFSNQLGYIFENQMLYNQTEISAQYRLWMSSFGYIDMMMKGGVQFSVPLKAGGNAQIPYVKLFYPTSSQSLLLARNDGFNMMANMEFATDKYISLFLTYHLNGLILNRIPLVNALKWREVVSFSGLYGHLSDNNKVVGINTLSPTMPYMEMTVGIENIFRLFRIDYVRRLSYTDGLTGWQKNGIKLTLSLNM